MQIHEITLAKKQQVDEGILDSARAAASKVGGMVQGAQQNLAQSKIDKKVAVMADKAYKAWTTYKNQIAKYYADAGKPAPANAYSSALTNFVQKNLMPGTKISSANNKDDILGLVKQISATSQPKVAPAQQGAQQPPAQQGAQQPPAQQPPAQQGLAPAQAKPVVAQMPAGTPQQAAQQAAGAMKPNQARTQATVAPATTPPAQPGQAQPTQPAQTQGRVPSTPAGANPAATVAPVPGQGPQANPPQKKKPVPAPGRTVQEAAAQGDTAKEKQLFTQLVRAAAMAFDLGGKDKSKKKKDKKNQPDGTDTPAADEPAVEPAVEPATTDQQDTGVYVAPGRRLKLPIKPKNPDQQPSYYYKTSDNIWTTEQGQPVASTSYDALEKLADSGAAREEEDPNYVAPATVKPTTTRKK